MQVNECGSSVESQQMMLRPMQQQKKEWSLFHLRSSRSAARPGEKKDPPATLSNRQRDTPLSPATLFDPLLSVSFTRPPPVKSDCIGLKLQPPRGENAAHGSTTVIQNSG